MNRKLNISVSKRPDPGGVVSCKSFSLREKLLDRLLGKKHKMMVLIPGDTVATVSISESVEGGAYIGRSGSDA